MRLRSSLALGFAAVATAVAATVGAATWSATASRLQRETDRSLLSSGAELRESLLGPRGPARGTPRTAAPLDPKVDPNGDPDDDQDGDHAHRRRRDAESRTVLPAQFVTADGTVTLLPLNTGGLPVTRADVAIAAADDVRRRFTVTRVAGREVRLLTWGAGDGRGAVQIARDLDESRSVLTALAAQVVAIGAATALLAAAAGYLLARRLTRRLERLGAATEVVTRTGSLDVEVPAGGDDEVAQLGRTFNEMLSALSDLRRRQDRLLADAGHELRTPLTSLRTNISLLDRFADLPPAARDRVVEDLRGESRELSTLVEEVLALARGAADAAPHEPLALAEVVLPVVERARRRAGRTIALTAPDDNAPVVVLGDRTTLQRAVWNLLDNAVKFDPSGAPVEVGLRVEAGRAVLTVADRGPGIPDGEREAVFARFHRGEQARSVPGSGLGLSIVADVVQAHRGDVRLVARDGGGTVAMLTLPLDPDPDPAPP